MGLFQKGNTEGSKKGKKAVVNKDIDGVEIKKRQEEAVAVPPVSVKVKKVVGKNVGYPTLGLGVDFYPSESVRHGMVLTGKSYEGEICLLLGEGLCKVQVVVNGGVKMFICKHDGDESINTMVDSIWKEK